MASQLNLRLVRRPREAARARWSLLRVAVAIALTLLTMPFLASPASAVLLNNFEIDGDRVPVTGIDWQSAGVTGSADYGAGRDDVDTDPHDLVPPPGTDFTGDRTIFASGKELNAPSTWVLTRGTNDNGSDISDHFVYDTVDATGDAWFYVGYKRTETGVAGYSVELNQLANVNGRPNRSVGDVIIAFAQGNGSTDFTFVDAKELTATGWVDASVTAATFGGATGELGTFGEIGINLTATGLQPDCSGGFNTVNMRSRSSSSINSDLKDYIEPISVSIPPRCKKLIINKFGPDGTTPLIGATFSITPNPVTGAAGAYVVTDGTTGTNPDGAADGTIQIATDRFTTYTVTETVAPAGYIRQTTAETAAVTALANGTVSFRNFLGSVYFEKVDKDSAPPKTKIGFATFRLTKTSGAAQGPLVVVDNDDHTPTLDSGDTLVSDLDPQPGEIKVGGLKVGDWTVTEIDPPVGYTLPTPVADRSQTFSITQPGTVGPSFIFTTVQLAAAFQDPRKLGTLIAKKFEAGTTDLIGGNATTSAQFKLYVDVNKNGTYEVGTDTPYAADPGPKNALDGTATWTDLPWGHYLVQEFRAPQGYQSSAAEFKPFVIDIDDVDSATSTPEVVEFFNQQVPSSLSVVKHEADVAGLIVPGATFELWRESNGVAGIQVDPATGDTLVHTCTTSADDAGTPADERVCRRSGLPFGTYYWLETAAPTGYALPQLADRLQFANANAVTIGRANAGSSFATLVIEDPKKLTHLRVVKLDGDTGLRVGGATFELYLEDNGVAGLQIDPTTGDALVGSCSTDPDDSGTPADERVCSLTDLTWGDYYWLETDAPTGYQLPPLANRLSAADAGMVTISAANAGTSLVVTEISDPQIRSELAVLKRDADTGGVVGGARFELWRESNRTADLQVGAGGDTLVDDCTTVGTAACSVSGLLFGSYYWLETDAPTGYVLPAFADRVSAPIVVDAVTAAADDYAVTEISDPQIRSELAVLKRDADTGGVVGGATFELWRESNATAGLQVGVGGDTLVDDCTTVGTAACSVSGLLFGSYYWLETDAPTGYVLPAFADRVSDAIVVDAVSAAADDYAVTGISDPQVRSELAVVKHDADAPGTVVDGAVFQLWQETNGVDGLQIEAFDDGGVTYDADGMVEQCDPTSGGDPCAVDGLLFGTYYWYELSAPTGYDLPIDAARVSAPIVVDADSAEAGLYPVTVIADPQVRSELAVIKHDGDTGRVVAGATFQLFRERNGLEGLQRGAGQDSLIGQCTTSGADPCSVTDQLLFGTYYWYELSPPTGYDLPADAARVSAPIVVDADSAEGGAYPVTVIADPQTRSELAVLKRDADTGGVVGGATFELWRESNAVAGLQVGVGGDTLVDDCTTAGSDPCGVGGLVFGTYYWLETDAPDGYDLPSLPTRLLVAALSAVEVDAVTAAADDYAVTEISDPQVRSTIEVLKSDDETAEVLDGAVFQAYRDEGTTPGELDASDTPMGGPVVTDAEGLARWTGLLFGTYLVEEVAAPAGYDLPGDTVQVVNLDATNAGSVVRLVFLDPAQGTLTTTKAAFELVDGAWVESDGLVEFGDQIRYVVTVTAHGPRIHHDVTVHDYVPGNDPDDTTSDTEGTYVAGTAACLETGDCTVSFDAAQQLLTWELGDMRDQTRSVEFVIEFPPDGVSPLVVGVVTATLANTAAVTWTDRGGDREIESNQVVLDAELEVLGVEEERPPAKPRPPAELPETGAPANTGLAAALGGLMLTVGTLLLFRRRREQL